MWQQEWREGIEIEREEKTSFHRETSTKMKYVNLFTQRRRKSQAHASKLKCVSRVRLKRNSCRRFQLNLIQIRENFVSFVHHFSMKSLDTIQSWKKKHLKTRLMMNTQPHLTTFSVSSFNTNIFFYQITAFIRSTIAQNAAEVAIVGNALIKILFYERIIKEGSQFHLKYSPILQIIFIEINMGICDLFQTK